MKNAADRQAEFLKMLANPVRLKIIDILKNGEKNVNEIHDELNIQQSATSQHLKILTNGDILTSKKDGLKTYFSIKNQEIYNVLLSINRFLSYKSQENIEDISNANISGALL